MKFCFAIVGFKEQMKITTGTCFYKNCKLDLPCLNFENSQICVV